ncbi:MAG TPA: NACHT domain-containing protein [Trichormus sp. M33_DOE_039]|nr:NACHT domain-containing protein [Trichormus sp. M33_DOE_039]
MPKRQRLSLKASLPGKQLIREARIRKIAQFKAEKIELKGHIEKGWDVDEIFLREVSKILEPHRNWDAVEKYAVALATWRRFREGKRITADYFQAFCQVLDLNWENVIESEIDADIDLSDEPLITKFYGRIQELAELQQWIIQKRSRLVLVHGMGGIGKSVLVRHLVDKIASKYHRLIWLSLKSAPPFQEILIKLVQFFSKGEQETGGINEIMQYLHRQKCLIVLDGWEEIIDNHSDDYAKYNQLLERVNKESHKSCLLVISRRKPQNIEILEGQFVYSKKLMALNYEEVKEFLKAERLFGLPNEIERFSKRYNNPWILKRIIQRIQNVFNGDLSPFMNNGEFTTFIDDVTTEFLNQQFQALSQAEINLIYWVAIRRNRALWEQLVQDSKKFLTNQQLIDHLNGLISKHSLLDKNIEETPLIYVLDPVILRYTTERFIGSVCQQINQVFQSGVINGDELFITHSFITEYPVDEELNQEQMRRIVQPMQKTLLANFRSQQHLETQLQKVKLLLEEQGYTSRNMLHLLAAGEYQNSVALI